MRPISKVLASAILITAWSAAQTAPTLNPKSPADALERAALYLDSSSARLDELISVIRNKKEEVNQALFQYMRQFSQFHVTIGELRTGKREASFATDAVREIRSQLSSLEAIRNDMPPGTALVFDEAVGHLRSALDMIHKLDSKSHRRVFTTGPD